MDKETIKHVLISILIGASVSFLTALLQGVIGLLHEIPTGLPGGATATVVYLRQWAETYYS